MENHMPRESRYLHLPDDYFSRQPGDVISANQLTLDGVDPPQKPFRPIFVDACRRCGAIHINAAETQRCREDNEAREQH